MDGAKSQFGEAELPTGVKLEDGEIAKKVLFREMAGQEEDILASPSLTMASKITSILANCTIELGTLKDPSQIRKAVEKLVMTDRWYYLVHLRIHSLGVLYKFEIECRECGKPDKQQIDLRELHVKNAPSPDKLIHETTLPSGNKVRWKVADGLVDHQIQKMAKPANVASVALFARCLEYNDAPPAGLVQFVNMSMRDRTHLRRDIDKFEGDFDDKFKTKCPSCGNEYEGEMELDPQSFFYPSE